MLTIAKSMSSVTVVLLVWTLMLSIRTLPLSLDISMNGLTRTVQSLSQGLSIATLCRKTQLDKRYLGLKYCGSVG